MTLLEEVAQLLHDLALGVYRADGTPGGTIYLVALPDEPDEALAVAPYGGAEGNSRRSVDTPHVQVRVRGSAADARTGLNRAQDVYDAVHALSSRALAGGTWLTLATGVQSGPVYMGRDQHGRHEYAVNLRLRISRPTPNRSV